MRKRSGANFDELLNKQWGVLSKNEQQELQAMYKKTEQRNGGISFYDMINIIRNTICPITEKRKDQINKEIANKEIRVLDLNTLISYAAILKREKEDNIKGETHQDNEYLDSFVALGGQRDKSGFVSKKTLIETIKNQFELTFDIETIIDNVQGDALDYSSFCEIFQQDRQKGDGTLAEAASQRSLRSSSSAKSLVIQERDFQKFIAQYESQELYTL